MDKPINERLREMTQAEGPGPEAALRRLVVFQGGFTGEAAGAILESSEETVDRTLATLQQYGFVTPQAANGRRMTRYWLDADASDYLESLVDEQTRRAHYDYYLALMRVYQEQGNYAGMDAEFENVEAAFEWAMQIGDAAAAYGLYQPAGHLLMTPARFDQGMDWLQRVIAALPSDADPYLLGVVQNSLGVAYQNAPTGDRCDNLHAAIKAYQRTLNYHSPHIEPQVYAIAQHNLGTAYADLARIENRLENLWQAVQAYKEALEYRTPDTAPLSYAATQNNLALAYREMAGIQNRKDNLQLALTACQEALRHYTPAEHSLDYAAAQNNLGNTYRALASVEHYAKNLHRAIAAYNEALKYRTSEMAPLAYAATQNNLGTAYRALSDSEKQAENLHRAISAFREAMRFYDPVSVPLDYAATHNNLGMAFHALAKVEDKAGNYQRAVGAYREALEYYTPTSAPLDYAKTQANLGVTQEELGELPTAIACWKEAARYFQDMGALDQAQLMQEWILNAGGKESG